MPERMNAHVRTERNSKPYTTESGYPNRVLNRKSPITNAKAVKAARIKRAAPGQKVTGKCSYPRFFYGSGSSHSGTIHRKRALDKPSDSVGRCVWCSEAGLRFRQFLLRGNKKVRTEMLIMAFGYNINRLHHKIQQNRTGFELFEKMKA